MPVAPAYENRFLTAPVGRLFWTNAVPMALVMSMSGLLNVVDAAFLGHFVGAAALTAVSLSFPVAMLTIALSTLVSGGMSSLLARRLGAGDIPAAGAVFAAAHGLALAIALGLAAGFFALGPWGLRHLSGAEGEALGMAQRFLMILICGTPVQFLLGLHADALRNEGRAGLLALLSVAVTLANIALNYGLIVGFHLGVAGSALGTVLAQAMGLGLLVTVRLRDARLLPLGVLLRHSWARGWGQILALGAPLSLSFIGMALVTATVIGTLMTQGAAGSAESVAAYGIVIRILGFTFMPMMAIAMAMQSIVGNNFGARLTQRSDKALRLALAAAFTYCLAIELALFAAKSRIGAGFVEAPGVVAEVGTILAPMLTLYLSVGPVLVLALYFQAIGQPGRAAALTLTKPFLLSPLLVLGFAGLWGARALWLAFPMGDAVMLALAALLLISAIRR